MHIPASNRLPLHEWLIVAIIISIMIAILMITSFRTPSRVQEPISQHILEEIEVKVTGAVIKPGYYTLNNGSTIEDVINQAGLTPMADTSKLQLKKELRDGQKINIPEIEMITINILGEVTGEKQVRVAKGSKVEDLLKIVEFTSEADLKPLMKKRKLKDGETIRVKRVKLANQKVKKSTNTLRKIKNKKKEKPLVKKKPLC